MNQPSPRELCEQFLGWQCRIRQHAVRKQEGRPPRGVSATVTLDGEFLGQAITMICKQDAETVTDELRFMVQRSVDPKNRYDSALKFLCEYYFQFPGEFDERLTALYALDNTLASQLLEADSLILDFCQANQRYQLHCTAVDQPPGSTLYEATYWHNHLFNPNMPGVVRVIGFETDWESSTFEQVAQ